LPNRGWRLQVETPTKGFKHLNKGTQQAKNIIANIELDGDYQLDGKTIKGRDLVDLIHGAYAELSRSGLEGFIDEMGFQVTETGEVILESSESLHQMLTEALKTRGASDATIDSLSLQGGHFMAPLSAHTERVTIQNML